MDNNKRAITMDNKHPGTSSMQQMHEILEWADVVCYCDCAAAACVLVQWHEAPGRVACLL